MITFFSFDYPSVRPSQLAHISRPSQIESVCENGGGSDLLFGSIAACENLGQDVHRRVVLQESAQWRVGGFPKRCQWKGSSLWVCCVIRGKEGSATESDRRKATKEGEITQREAGRETLRRKKLEGRETMGLAKSGTRR